MQVIDSKGGSITDSAKSVVLDSRGNDNNTLKFAQAKINSTPDKVKKRIGAYRKY